MIFNFVPIATASSATSRDSIDEVDIGGCIPRHTGVSSFIDFYRSVWYGIRRSELAGSRFLCQILGRYRVGRLGLVPNESDRVQDMNRRISERSPLTEFPPILSDKNFPR